MAMSEITKLAESILRLLDLIADVSELTFDPKAETEEERTRPTEKQIRQRAYDIWCHRNGGPGSDIDDWRQAEAELRSQRIRS